ncbi:hypothetical protein LY76DRAFT_362264 [Colletotrichum caudatum]|nr:hypothetical protein LY76DRAFT_362264 [Colletotrichum caudatum]
MARRSSTAPYENEMISSDSTWSGTSLLLYSCPRQNIIQPLLPSRYLRDHQAQPGKIARS